MVGGGLELGVEDKVLDFFGFGWALVSPRMVRGPPKVFCFPKCGSLR